MRIDDINGNHLTLAFLVTNHTIGWEADVITVTGDDIDDTLDKVLHSAGLCMRLSSLHGILI